MPNRWKTWPNTARGALNLVDAAAIARATESIVRNEPVTLGLPIGNGLSPAAPMRPPVQHFMLRDGGDYAGGLSERPGYGFADDVVILPCHGTTHVDALSHVWQDGVMWGGLSSDTVTSRGARHFGIESVGPIVTRSLLIDLADEHGDGLEDGEPITIDHITYALRASGLSPEPGDALLIRTGWLARWRAKRASTQTWPGLHESCAPWLIENGISLVGADNISVEVEPSGNETCAMPLHIELIRDNGVFFIELLDLEELAARAASSAMLVVAPLHINGASGSPVAPVAII